MNDDANLANGQATYIALGTNAPLGELSGPALLRYALERIEDAGVKVLKRSGYWLTAPWPPELAGQAPYVNAAAAVDPGDLDPPALFAVLNAMEAAFGRARRERWAARTLDLDIIDFRGFIGAAGALTLPHPRMHERAFVLAPLAEIAPHWRHPGSGLSVQTLLDRVKNEQEIKKMSD